MLVSVTFLDSVSHLDSVTHVSHLDAVTCLSPGLSDVPADDVLDEAALLLHHLLAGRLSAHGAHLRQANMKGK